MRTESTEASSQRQKLALVLTFAFTLAVLGALAWVLHRPAATAQPMALLHDAPLDSAVRVNGLLTVRGQSGPFTGRLYQNYPDGSKKLEMEVRRGRLDGHSRGWYSGGQLEVDESFTGDYSEGTRTRWYANGTKKSVTTILHGQLEGPCKQWHENGQMAATMNLRQGLAEGMAEAWHPSGSLKSRSIMEKGRVVSRQFYDDAVLAQTLTH